MIGLCPGCKAELLVSDYVEVVRCPRCKSIFHPEHLLMPYPNKV